MKYTREELKAAFDAVESPKGWKFPINATIESKDIDVTVEAISYFAGSPTNVGKILKNGKVKITAPGYYKCVGA